MAVSLFCFRLSASAPIVTTMPASGTFTRARGHQGAIRVSRRVVSSRIQQAETGGFAGFVRYWTRLEMNRICLSRRRSPVRIRLGVCAGPPVVAGDSAGLLHPVGAPIGADGSAVEAADDAWPLRNGFCHGVDRRLRAGVLKSAVVLDRHHMMVVF